MFSILREPEQKCSKISASRVILFLGFGVVLTTWVAILVVVLLSDRPWDHFSGALTWGRDFFFVTVLPYVGNVLGAGISKIGKQNEGGTS